jgi:ABC-2 type transport system ATP-binding protein
MGGFCMNAIEVEDLTKIYGTTIAVDCISLNVKRGEIFGMLGRNGAGKTTTIECVIGLREYDKGFVEVLGLNPQKEQKTLFNRVGVQFQEASFQDKIKVSEICRLFESFYKNPYSYKVLLDRFDLSEKTNSYVNNLSGGQRQRLSIILALISNPELVFLDELTTGLDPQARHSMWDYVRELREEGKTIFMTTHYMEEAEYLCDRICIIDNGKIIALGTINEVINSCEIHNEITYESEQDISCLLKDRIKQISDIKKEGNKYTVYGKEDCILGKLAYILETEKIGYWNLDIRRPNLDDVFIKMTGRGIGESGE